MWTAPKLREWRLSFKLNKTDIERLSFQLNKTDIERLSFQLKKHIFEFSMQVNLNTMAEIV